MRRNIVKKCKEFILFYVNIPFIFDYIDYTTYIYIYKTNQVLFVN